MNYYICEGKIENISKYNAGSKALQDVEHILNDINFKPFFINSIHRKSNKKILRPLRFIKFFINYFIWKKSFNELESGDLIVIQYPLHNRVIGLDKIIKKYTKKINIVLLIHDMESIRRVKVSKNFISDEKKIIKSCDYVISHNEIMSEKIKEIGVDKSKIVNLELFDYICKENKKKSNNNPEKIIAYVGNLIQSKAPFISQIEDDKINFILKLFGKGIDSNISNKVLYCGAYMPDELPEKLQADLGLVWDGNIDESDENTSYKKYTKYNNPHKLSCYIAAGLPVIVWRKSAAAQFVNKYNIGYTISNLYDINNLDFSDYEEKLKNVSAIQKKVCNGKFTKDAINKVLEKIKKN